MKNNMTRQQRALALTIAVLFAVVVAVQIKKVSYRNGYMEGYKAGYDEYPQAESIALRNETTETN